MSRLASKSKLFVLIALVVALFLGAYPAFAEPADPQPQPLGASQIEEDAVVEPPQRGDPYANWRIVHQSVERHTTPQGAVVTITQVTRERPSAANPNSESYHTEACEDPESNLLEATLSISCSFQVDLSTLTTWDFAYAGQHLYHKLDVVYKRYIYTDGGTSYYGYWIQKNRTWWERTSTSFDVTSGDGNPNRPYIDTFFNGINCNNDYTENTLRTWVSNPTWNGNSTYVYYTTTPSQWGVKSRALLGWIRQEVVSYSQVLYNGNVVGSTGPSFVFPAGYP